MTFPEFLDLNSDDKQHLLECFQTWPDSMLVDDVLKVRRLLDNPDIVESVFCDFFNVFYDVLMDECFRRFAISCDPDLNTPPISSQPVRQCPECNGASGTPRRQMGAPFL